MYISIWTSCMVFSTSALLLMPYWLYIQQKRNKYVYKNKINILFGLKKAYPVLEIWEVGVPSQCNCIYIQHPKPSWQEVEVDHLCSRPDTPVRLKNNNTIFLKNVSQSQVYHKLSLLLYFKLKYSLIIFVYVFIPSFQQSLDLQEIRFGRQKWN